MSDWDDDDEEQNEYDRFGWDYYSASRPRKVKDGIKIRSERGAIGTTWWSKRWVRALESLGMGSRLTRGRSYARQGQVVSIDIEPGLVKAKVQGSLRKPYDIKIALQPLDEREWDAVTDVMAAQAIFAAKLLAGQMPENIEEAFSAAHVSLFPVAQEDLQTRCSCPDWANPCKHIAAVYYVLADRFDEDPFLIFKLRGRSKEPIIEVLRRKRAGAAGAQASVTTSGSEQEHGEPEEMLRLEDHMANFWQMGEKMDRGQWQANKDGQVDKAVLKRLGDVPAALGGKEAKTWLSHVYDSVAQAVVQQEDH